MIRKSLDEKPKEKLGFFWGEIFYALIGLNILRIIIRIVAKFGWAGMQQSLIESGAKVSLLPEYYEIGLITDIVIPFFLIIILIATLIGIILRKKFGLYLVGVILVLSVISGDLLSFVFACLYGVYFYKRRDRFK